MTEYEQSIRRLRNSALGAATVRAFAALEGDPAIRNPDTLAREFIDPALRPDPSDGAKVAAFRAQLEAMLPGAYHFQNARTHHVDARMRAAIESGVRQVVILGAGYDSRAYRFADLAPGLRFIEVDMPALQAEKQATVARVLGALPGHVSYVPLDFNRQPLTDILAAGGYDPTLPVFFNWEGVSYYLDAAGVDATLDFVSRHSPAGSRILFDYMPAAMVDGSGDYHGGAESRAHMAGMGEPLRFGIPDGTLEAFLAARGLRLASAVGPDELENAYLVGRDGVRQGRISGYVRMAEAVVAGR
ncbi:MAG: SAM-dependent methyltransferase [Pseudomonadota bacterium]|nr:SAM-dependent methyltransferase [Pseudomonadota bacterium]